jgi:hypothetical protein
MMRSKDFSRLVQGWMAGCLAATAIISGFLLVALATASKGIVEFLVAAIIVSWVPILVFILTGGLTLVPAALVVWISERFRIRSILFFGGAGAVMGGLMALLRFTKLTQTPELDRLVYISAGLAAGLAYWFVAGRYAGEGRSGDPPPLPPAAEAML